MIAIATVKRYNSNGIENVCPAYEMARANEDTLR